MNTIDIYNEFSNWNNKLVLPENPIISSVFIPTIHKKFTNAAIYHVFDAMFGCVTRIDNVHIKTKDGSDSKFKSAFVYFIAYHQPTNVMDAIGRNEKVRINPNVNTSYMRTYFPQPNPKIRNSEFWLLLPNNKVVPDTTLTLAQIRDKIDALVPIVAWDQEEDEALTVNFGFWVELEAKLAGRPNDTSINIHQLARNIELMEERVKLAPKDKPKVLSYAAAVAEPKPLVDSVCKAIPSSVVKTNMMNTQSIPAKADPESKDVYYDDACNSAERGSRSMGGYYAMLNMMTKTDAL
jgi:hypothetical protein